MQLNFYKYQGTGNDFIIIDAREKPINLNTNQIAFLCDRRFGIGADGLMILVTSDRYDFEMIYYNADGEPGSMCGNGGRCLVQFALKAGYIKKQTTFIATDGLHEAKLLDHNDWISLKMGNVYQIDIRSENECFMNTGSPHLVQWVLNPNEVDVKSVGTMIRYNNEFKELGTNVNFVSVDKDTVFVRTYERGVEDETLSCGTGVTASVLAASATNRLSEDATFSKVKTLGGQLIVRFEKDKFGFSNVWLEGPAIFVFKGAIDII
jgi:diaminopimelate epimerase